MAESRLDVEGLYLSLVNVRESVDCGINIDGATASLKCGQLLAVVRSERGAILRTRQNVEFDHGRHLGLVGQE